MPRTSSESDKWKAILDDPATPPDLQTEARRHLGLDTNESVNFIGTYNPALDSVVESLWGARWVEGETPHPTAKSIYCVLACALLLGGIPSEASEHARLLLTVLPRCESPWMQSHVKQALRLLVRLYGGILGPELVAQIESATGDLDKRQEQMV